MSPRFIHGLRLTQLTTSVSTSRARHIPSSSRSITTSLTLDTSAYTTATSPSPTELLIAVKTRDLLNSLGRDDPNPSRPWGHYVDLLNYMGLEKLPLEVHQLVLRKCVPPASVIRTISVRRHRARYYPHAPHAYENRLQTVMKNIRSAGWQTELNDYHFVLEQFAAVGHYVGSRGVLREMTFAGVEPRAKTYGLCLQALAHRLTLPCTEERYPALVGETTKMARELIRDMHARNVPFTSVNLDLAIRILRETVDEKSFDDLIKFGYGIDLAYPDRLPIGVIEQQSGSKAASADELEPPSLPLQPLSTPGLNVVIDMLGRSGRISKMVQAFEVLTQPLTNSCQSSSISLFDEDEDDYSINPPSIPEPAYPLPSASPNSTTFQYLIMHASTAGHAVFARHYLVHAMHLDREENKRLRHELSTLPVDQITPPLLAVNRNMLLPVFGLSNREKQVELMRWTLKTIKRTLRRKREDLRWYADRRAAQEVALGDGASGLRPGSGSVPWEFDACSCTTDIDSPSSSSSDSGVLQGVSDSMSPTLRLETSAGPPPSGAPTAASTTIPTSSASADPPPTPSVASSVEPSNTKTKSPIFDIDLDSDHSPPTPRPRVFNIDVHISLLQRDILQLKQLSLKVEAVLGRTIHRIKERLGRRVWSGKDIWLTDEQKRVEVSKEFWRDAVNFVSPRVTEPLQGRSSRQGVRQT
jgi:hypothetical protein